MSSSSLTRRTSFRLAVSFAGLFGIAVAVILSVLYFAISSELTKRLKTHVDEFRATLVEKDQSGSFDDVKQLVTSYAADAEPEESMFLLTDTANNFVAGNVGAFPMFFGWRTMPWQQLPLAGKWNTASESTAVIGRWTDVKGGHLFVGSGNGDINEVQNIVVDGLGLSVLLALLAALVGGALLGWRAQQRIASMETALASVSHGELSSRVPRSFAGDDLDHVAALINKTLDRMQALIGSLKQVTADVAHDLKSPIGRVLQKLESVGETASAPEAYKATVAEARHELATTVQTFEALLRIAEIEGGARKSRFSDVDLKSLLLNVIEMLDAVASDAGDRLTHNVAAAKTSIVRGDKELLTQVFINLIENAIRHCPVGSHIDVALSNDGTAPAVAVADNGPGIPPHERDNVFRRLYRLEKSRTTPGNGLGLSLVSAIVDLHDAKISLSDNHPGLIVTVTFLDTSLQD